jgi:uncharacterized protein (TIGR01777 family)
VVRLVRSATDEPDTLLWSPERGELDPDAISGADAVINLNGRNVGDGRWTDGVKRELESSRLQPTRLLAEAFRRADQPPPLLINASAVGVYGDRGEQELDESSAPSRGFLPELSVAWETAAAEARSDRTRVVLLRLGMVIGRGGALAKMLPAFRLGLGGKIGPGSQWWPWVSMEDVIGVTRFALENDEIDGPVNVVSPEPIRCRDFVRVLGRILHRPTVLPMPAFAARLALGEMAEALLLASARVRPAALERLGYEFRVPELDAAIRQAID